jgi:hypothetical protein
MRRLGLLDIDFASFGVREAQGGFRLRALRRAKCEDEVAALPGAWWEKQALCSASPSGLPAVN